MHHADFTSRAAIGTIVKSVDAHADIFLPFAVSAIAVALAFALFQIAYSANDSIIHDRLRIHFNTADLARTS